MLSSAVRNKKYLGLHHENVDSKVRFSIEPLAGDDAFDQWKDGMKAVAGLPMGIPVDFRKKVWLALADKYLNGFCLDWEQTKRLAFNEKANPDDNKLDMQIVKDLHRTGFSSTDKDEDRSVLKRVLLAYARWNKQVGYCQGFNVMAALILDVMEGQEDCALKVMIYLIDRVLPEGYFINNLRALSVDMAVFRDLLQLHMPRFSRHLDRLQTVSADPSTGANYEPPLTNVFTMQWFLTLFATCLPKSTALRVWDAVFLEGSEILLRTGVAIWGVLQHRLMKIQSADEFYTTMASLTQEMIDGTIVDADQLIKNIYEMGPFPMPGLSELRSRYSQCVAPCTTLNGRQSVLSPGDFDDQLLDATCFAGIFPPGQSISPERQRKLEDSGHSHSATDQARLGPADSSTGYLEILGIRLPIGGSDKSAMDVDVLNQQYRRLRQRQKDAQILLAVAANKQLNSLPDSTLHNNVSPIAVNHLFVGRDMMLSKMRATTKQSGKPTDDITTTNRSKSPSSVADRSTASDNKMAAVQKPEEAASEYNQKDSNKSKGNNSDLTESKPSCLKDSTAYDVAAVSDNTSVAALASPSRTVHCTVVQPKCTGSSGPTEVQSKYEQSSPTSQNRQTESDCPTATSLHSTDRLIASNNRPVASTAETFALTKVFNPFPKQHVNHRRTKNGIRLGLYTAEALQH